MFSFRLPLPFLGSSAPDDGIELEPVHRERLSPAEFLQTVQSDRDNIKSTTFVTPRLGDNHFGYFEVEYDTPIYK